MASTGQSGGGTLTQFLAALDDRIRVAVVSEGNTENLAHAEVMKKHPHMEHDDPNGVRLSPYKSAELVWKFTKTGTFEYSCLIPDHREYGMIGKVTVKEPGKTGERKKP